MQTLADEKRGDLVPLFALIFLMGLYGGLSLTGLRSRLEACSGVYVSWHRPSQTFQS